MTEYKRFEHQEQALTAITKAMNAGIERNKVIIPTGGGKTNIEIDTCKVYLDKCDAAGKKVVIAILAPRIALCLQLMKEHVHNPMYGDTKWHPMALHSGREDVGPDYLITTAQGVKYEIEEEEDTTNDGEITSNDRELLKSISDDFAEVKCITSSKDIKEEYNRVVKGMDKHLIIYSTYKSAHRLKAAGIPLGIVIADEAQFLVTNAFTNLHNLLKPEHWFFFTATEKTTLSSKGPGMNNPVLFGEGYTYTIDPATLITKGIIVEPMLHVVYVNGIRMDGVSISSKKAGGEYDKSGNFNAVKEVIKSQVELTTTTPKILVACKDVDEVAYLAAAFLDDCEFDEYTIFSTSSRTGNVINGKKYNRREFLKQLTECTGKALIFHYDILSEGIDVAGISGVVFLRYMGIAKMLQTIGRALRVLVSDRPLPLEERLKQFALVSVPVINSGVIGSEDYNSTKELLKEVVKTMILGGFKVDEWKDSKPKSKKQDDDPLVDPIVQEEPVSETTFTELFVNEVKVEVMQKRYSDEKKMFELYMEEVENLDEFLYKRKSITFEHA